MINTVPYLAALFVPTAGGSFDPSQLSGLTAWWLASLGITLSGSDVDQWADQSGNSHTLTWTSPVPAEGPLTSVRPAYITSGGGTLNGYPGVKFGNSVTSLSLAADLTFATSGSIYIVYRTSSAGGVEILLTKDDNGYIATRSNQVDIAGGSTLANTMATSTAYTLSAQILGASSSKIGLNPEVLGYGSSGSGIPILRSIGVYNYGLHFLGHIYEIVVYSRTLNSTEDGQVLAYLRTKYAHY